MEETKESNYWEEIVFLDWPRKMAGFVIIWMAMILLGLLIGYGVI